MEFVNRKGSQHVWACDAVVNGVFAYRVCFFNRGKGHTVRVRETDGSAVVFERVFDGMPAVQEVLDMVARALA